MKRIKDFFGRVYKWLTPGLEVKRWLFLSWIGLIIFAFGFLLLTNIRIPLNIELAIVDFFNKMKIPLSSRMVDLLIVLLGLGIMIYAQKQWFKSLYTVIVPIPDKKLVELVYEKRKLDTGFKIVAIGGGTGLSTLLRGLKKYTSNISAVVAVSDDGGSSGILRDEFGIIPPGDIRNCLAALAKDESALSSLFQYRFEEGRGLEGHSFGNLFLTALNKIAGDDFQKAIKISGDILNIQGNVYPATLEKVVLCAEMENGGIICGESDIPKHQSEIKRIFLRPENCNALPEVITAIKEADAVILGPGSLYTSILPNLQVKDIREAVRKTNAIKIYICNVMTQAGETPDFKASEHLKALFRSSEEGIVSTIIVNNEMPTSLLEKYRLEGAKEVEPDTEELQKMGVEVVLAPLLNEQQQVRHDYNKLAETVIKTITEKLHSRKVKHHKP